MFLWLLGVEGFLIAIYQQKMHFFISWNTLTEVHFPFVFKMNGRLFFIILSTLAFSFCSAIGALVNSDMKGIFNDKLKIY